MEKDRGSIKGIKYISFHENSGYGIAAYRYIKGLTDLKIPLTWMPLVTGKKWKHLGYKPLEDKNSSYPEFAPFFNKKIEYDTVIIHTVPEYYPVFAEMETGKTLIGCTVWETTKPPYHWISLLNSLDSIIVPCRWNREVFEKNGVSVPIHVVPHIFDNKSVVKKKPADTDSENFIFYTIETWTARKAIWNTVKCYLNTFSADDPVELKIKTSKNDFTNVKFKRYYQSPKKALKKIVKKYPNPAHISLICSNIKDHEIQNLHQMGNCYISLTRSEGWGLGAFDAAGFGKPVIMTGFGGQLDYLPGDDAYLVNYNMIPVNDKNGGISYTSDQNWAEPDLAHGSMLMREVFENQKAAQKKGQCLKEYIRSNFSKEVVIRKLLTAISSIKNDTT